MKNGEAVESELSSDQKRALFEAYEKARVKLTNTAVVLDATVKAIAEQIGPGPFRWQGQELSIAKRGERFTMRVKGQEVEEIV